MTRPPASSLLLALIVSCAAPTSPSRGPDAASVPPAATPAVAPATTPTRSPAARPRQTTDRPDDREGYQVHFLYVVPSDGRDEGLDTNGWIVSAVESAQKWLERETGGRRLSVDTFGGELDVTFLRLSRTDTDLAAHDRDLGASRREPLLRVTLEAEIRSRFYDPKKIYGVYYGGGSAISCAGGSYPPGRVGNIAINHVVADPKPGQRPCDETRMVFPDGTYAGGTGMFHEIFHSRGAVGTCSRHHDSQSAGHIADDPQDLMSARHPRVLPIRFDAGRDDYFGHGRADCLDLARSAFLVPAPANAEPPPLWPLVTARRRDCAEERALGTVASGPATGIVFDNLSDRPMQFFILGPQGRARATALDPWLVVIQRASAGQAFLVADAIGECLAIFVAQDSWARASVRR